MAKKKKTKRQKIESIYGWIGVFFAIDLFFFCDGVFNMVGVKSPLIRIWIDLAVVYGALKLYSTLIDKHLDKKYGTEK